MVDSVETARAFGITFQSSRRAKFVGPGAKGVLEVTEDSFQSVLKDWFGLSCVLNNLNRGLGLPDGYPFVLSDPVIEKLRFVHDVISHPEKGTEVPAEKPAAERPAAAAPQSPREAATTAAGL
jgi:hypothetical protein